MIVGHLQINLQVLKEVRLGHVERRTDVQEESSLAPPGRLCIIILRGMSGKRYHHYQVCICGTRSKVRGMADRAKDPPKVPPGQRSVEADPLRR